MKLATLLLLFVALVIVLSAVVLAQAKKKIKPPETIELMNPMENPDRTEVGILSGGKYRINKEEGLGLQELGKKLREIVAKRAPDRRAVIFHAPAKTKYGEVAQVLGEVVAAGVMPIIPVVKSFDEMVKFELVSAIDLVGDVPVALPSASSPRSDVYLRHKMSVVVTIPEAGVYFIGEKKLNATNGSFEQELTAGIRAGLEKLGPEIPHSVYVRCSQDAPYSEIGLLMRAVNKAGAEAIMLVVEKR